MKKIVGLMLALMMLSVFATGLAEEAAEPAEPVVIEFSEDSIAAIEGEFVNLEAADMPFEFYLPAMLLPQEITEEYAAQGMIAYYANAEMTRNISVVYSANNMVNAEGAPITTIPEIIAYYAAAGYNAQAAFVNDMESIIYVSETADACGVLFPLEDGNMLSFNFAPQSDAEYNALAETIISSIHYYGDEAEADGEAADAEGAENAEADAEGEAADAE